MGCGSTTADTGVEGIGIGLSGGGLGGSDGELDLANFCCPEYLSTMLQLIPRQWDANHQVPGALSEPSLTVRLTFEYRR